MIDLKNIFKNADSISDTSVDEILGYMGCRDFNNEEMRLLCEKAKNEVGSVIRPKAVWRFCEISNVFDDTVDFGFTKLSSSSLKEHLKNCKYACFMAATLGSQLDILIKKHSVSAMSYAVSINAAGASYIESYCDYIENMIKEQTEGFFLTSRFSPGYGDLQFECQKDIFSYLDATKNTGVYLTDSFMMMPSKSVCAIIGIGNKDIKKVKCNNKCALCDNLKCQFRKG